MENRITSKAVVMGFMHMLVAFTSIVVVTRICGFNLPAAFLFAGIGTLIFHICTKNKLPMVMGVSGLYIGGILYVSKTYGAEYAFGGVVVAGVMYLLFAALMWKWQDQILKLFPEWLLSTVVLLIGLTLLPIGKMMVDTNMLIGVAAFFVAAGLDLFGGKKLGMFAMPIGLAVGTLIAWFTGALDLTPLSSDLALEFMSPKFNLASFLTIGLISLAVLFEMMGDTKNTSDIIGLNVFKEVGLARVSLGNGLSTIISGMGGGNAYTTYSENSAFVMLSKYFNPWAQVFTAFFFIIIAFVTPISKAVLVLPAAAFGGVVTYLFAMIAINSIKQVLQSGINLATDKKPFVIMTVMVGLSSLAFIIGGISISSVAVATGAGVILNAMIPDKKTA